MWITIWGWIASLRPFWKCWSRKMIKAKILIFPYDVIKWKRFPRYWPFVRGIHRSPMTSPHKGQWRGALIFSLICVWINGWVNIGEAGDLRCYRDHYNVTVMHRPAPIYPRFAIFTFKCMFLRVINLNDVCPKTVTLALLTILKQIVLPQQAKTKSS